MPKRDYAVELGLEMLLDGEWGQSTLRAVHDVSGTHRGYEISADYSYRFTHGRFSIAPSVGGFLADNFQISGMFGLGYVATDNADAMLVSLLVEPSYDIPVTRSVFAFLGIGLGIAHVEDLGVGFATAPRIGMNVMVGRSGILTPSLSWQYTTHDADTADGASADSTTVAVSSAARFNVGYTVMW